MNRLITTFIGKKLIQTQKFDDRGKRIPVTVVDASPCIVVQIMKKEKNGYDALQLGVGIKKEKNTTKPILGHLKKAGINKIPRFLREVRLQKPLTIGESPLKVGSEIKVSDVFTVGDTVNVTGTSKGRGFTGVVKRHHFKGGPRTHGQSDRERAPGAIGQTTTPGRVYKGKRMAGRSGTETVTVKNLKIVDIDNSNNRLIIKGLVPGVRNSLLTIHKA